MNKATAVAPSNIAFIKYWGRKDETLRLPANGSISMNLSNLFTTTTVEFSSSFKEDSFVLNGKKEDASTSRGVNHLERVRKYAGIKAKAKIVTENNFPTGTGLSSSASGFAALTVAAAAAADLSLSEKELSILARQGSGSACRSIPDGFVEWLDGNTSETSYSESLYPPDYWDIVDVVAVVSKQQKDVSSSEGHTKAASSPFMEKRLEGIKQKMERIKKVLKEKSFPTFGELTEEEALELHAIYITSHPSLIYLLPGTLRVMHAVKRWRADGLEVYFTLNTGQDIHLICQKKDAKKVAKLAEEIPEVQKTIINTPAKGARLIEKDLF
jgi:diphosphomevalonate decarboxylase